jgi:hypothetical protein
MYFGGVKGSLHLRQQLRVIVAVKELVSCVQHAAHVQHAHAVNKLHPMPHFQY